MISSKLNDDMFDLQATESFGLRVTSLDSRWLSRCGGAVLSQVIEFGRRGQLLSP